MNTLSQIEEHINKNPDLAKQLFEDIPKLTTNAKSVISRQATINIGIFFIFHLEFYFFRNNRTCGSWKINSCSRYFRS